MPSHSEHRLANPLLSVIIPTYDRQEYAASAIRTALAIPSDDLEVVVQDCSEADLLSSMVHRERLDPRLSFQHDPRQPVNMTENWNRALARATGDYICIIGDDDGVNPEIMQAAAWAKSRGIDCLAVKHTADYLWNNTGVPSTRLRKVVGGCLKISKFEGEIVTEVDPEWELQKLVRDGGIYYSRFNLPKLYHGLVRRECLDRVRQRLGACCGGLSPDIFPSVAVACLKPRIAVTDYPLTIPGACKASNSVIVTRLKRHSKKVEDDKDFQNSCGYQWQDVVPRIFTVQTVWADSAVAALRAMGRDDLLRDLNLPKLAAHCVRNNRGVLRDVLIGLADGLRRIDRNVMVGVVGLFWHLLRMTIGFQFARIRSRFLIITGKRRIDSIEGLNDMVEVSHALSQYLQDRNWHFSECAHRVDKGEAFVATTVS